MASTNDKKPPATPAPASIVPDANTFDPGLPASKTSASNDSDTQLNCPFCHISSTFPSYSPLSPPSPFPPSTSTSPHPRTFLLLSTPLLVAFLDIMPLSPGHLLLCPRRHAAKLTDVFSDEAAELGKYLRILSEAVTRATGIKDWNVVQNNGAAAAQVVEHMHFHVIPRPGLREAERFTSTMFGRGRREDLDEEEGEELAGRIRGCVREVVREEKERERGRKAKL
ncbi:HIT-like domain-containing protein [Pseudoneurospora amorphoporcata]|uniref:HIT-like domain-containing protein n=1 Tax=Pseudoneurospora amorphoporcata TaxID=241081 RepID=A0AAN6P321_9PEZI|nr:HIT-like domain-containing protein [Pseudoneurospora amorphoporcata]